MSYRNRCVGLSQHWSDAEFLGILYQSPTIQSIAIDLPNCGMAFHYTYCRSDSTAWGLFVPSCICTHPEGKSGPPFTSRKNYRWNLSGGSGLERIICALSLSLIPTRLFGTSIVGSLRYRDWWSFNQGYILIFVSLLSKQGIKRATYPSWGQTFACLLSIFSASWKFTLLSLSKPQSTLTPRLDSKTSC